MPEQVEEAAVTYVVDYPVKLDDNPDVKIPPGQYSGTRKRLGVSIFGGVKWMKPEYRLEITMEQEIAMGNQNVNLSASSATYDVTRHVERREFKVLP